MTDKVFASEAEMVACYCAYIEERNEKTHYRHPTFTIYHETAGWDLLLVEDTYGYQVGIEAKLSLNVKVLTQALSGLGSYGGSAPDYRAVLVPSANLQQGLGVLARQLGLTVITARGQESWGGRMNWWFGPDLPDEQGRYHLEDWHSWLPAERCKLPDYIPDVKGGKASPVMLSEWKIKAIKLLIRLERKGYVTRGDMRGLQISESRWTAPHGGFLVADRGHGGYVAGPRTPNLKAQHPVNWLEIEADYETWSAFLPF